MTGTILSPLQQQLTIILIISRSDNYSQVDVCLRERNENGKKKQIPTA